MPVDWPARRPVLQTKAALQEERPNSVRVVVDNAASQQNVQRFLESQGFQTKLEQTGADYLVIGTCDSAPGRQVQSPAERPSPEPQTEVKKIMVMCATDRIGFGDDELGLSLMVNFLRTLKGNGCRAVAAGIREQRCQADDRRLGSAGGSQGI